MLPSLSRFLCIFAVLSGLLSGCTTTPATPDHIEAPPDEIASVLDQGLVPVVRYGRYTVIELVPQPAQRDLLQQAVEITIPPTLDATVGDAMRHVLLRSGYRLCDGTEAAALYALPLPAAHLHLGPLLLRDALLVLAGPAWALSVDDRTREICFNRSADAAEVQS
jgi:type IV pili sensor histidine kinase/response regulator